MKSLTEDWLVRAKEDLNSANDCLSDAGKGIQVAVFSRQCMEKSFRAVAESRNIELPASYDLMQLAKLVRHYHPDLDMDMIQAMNDLKPDDPDNERTAFLGQPAITDADAAAFPEFAGKVLSACTSICRHSGYDDSQLWDSHSLLYL